MMEARTQGAPMKWSPTSSTTTLTRGSLNGSTARSSTFYGDAPSGNKLPKSAKGAPWYKGLLHKKPSVQESASKSQENTCEQPARCDIKNEVLEVGLEDLSSEDVIIAVMGPTGTGKSSFINLATGKEDGVGHRLVSCTQDIRAIKFHVPEMSSLDVVLVDTPGFDDTYHNDVEILDMIADWLKKTYQKEIKLAGIIYVHRITDNRMGGTPLRNLRIFEKLCGPSALENIILMTTMWDELEDEKQGFTREEELKAKYWRGMIQKGSSVVRYHNTRDSAWGILDHFLASTNERYAVLLQRELVDMRKRLGQTQAGQELYGALAGVVERQQWILRTIQRDANPLRGGADDVLSGLRAEYEDLGAELAKLVAKMQALKVPLGTRLRHFISIKLCGKVY